MNTCRAYASDGEIVRRRWPELYTGADAIDEAAAPASSYTSPEVETPFSLSHTVRGLPFMVQRKGLAMVWLK